MQFESSTGAQLLTSSSSAIRCRRRTHTETARLVAVTFFCLLEDCYKEETSLLRVHSLVITFASKPWIYANKYIQEYKLTIRPGSSPARSSD